MAAIEHNALALPNQSIIPGYRSRLIEFYGYEGEDFRHFQEILESYLAISNTTDDNRKLIILKCQLRRAAKVYFERVIVKETEGLTFDKALSLLRKHYITPELIQSYELEFNEMFQGDQEHPQIFLARLREAADLADIESEAVIQSRFRAGLLPDIKKFCIQSSARNFKEWVNHAEGWWNAHRPRKIAMVDNPFIPRNINNALIQKNESAYTNRKAIRNHTIELVDTTERTGQAVSIADIRQTGRYTYGPHQLTAMEISEKAGFNSGNSNVTSQVQHDDLVHLIQEAIRKELNSQQSYQANRYNNRNYRSNYSNNFNNNRNSNGYSQQYNRTTNQGENNHAQNSKN